MSTPRNHGNRRTPSAMGAGQRGFGLVELMVSLVLGLIVVGGALVLLLSTRQSTSTTVNLSRMQDSVRTSYDLMTREVREAGGTPCDARLLAGNVLNNAQGGAPTWWATWAEPVFGYEGGTAFPGAAIGAAVGERVNATDAVIVRYAPSFDGVAVTAHVTGTTTFTTNVLDHGIAVNDLVLVCNYRQAAVLNVSAINLATGTFAHAPSVAVDGNCSAGLGVPTDCTPVGKTYQFSAGSLVGRFTAVGWYVGNNGRPATGGRSLYRVTRTGTEEVAEGVRDLQLTYLVANAADYVNAGAVAATDWQNVTAVRFQITFESPDTGVSTAASAPRLARVVSYTVNLRNQQP